MDQSAGETAVDLARRGDLDTEGLAHHVEAATLPTKLQPRHNEPKNVYWVSFQPPSGCLTAPDSCTWRHAVRALHRPTPGAAVTAACGCVGTVAELGEDPLHPVCKRRVRPAVSTLEAFRAATARSCA